MRTEVSTSNRKNTILTSLLFFFMIMGYFFWNFPDLLKNLSWATYVYGDSGDPFQLYYLSWSLKQNLLHFHLPIYDYYNFASTSGPMLNGEISFLFWVSAITSMVFPSGFSHSFAFYYLPILLSAVFTYLLLLTLTKNRALAYCLTPLAVFFPYKIQYTVGSSQASSYYFFFPLVLWVLERHWRLRHKTLLQHFLLFFIIILGTVFNELHCSYYLMLMCFFWSIFHCIFLAAEEKSIMNGIRFFIRDFYSLGLGAFSSLIFGWVVHSKIHTVAKIKMIRSIEEIKYYSKSMSELLSDDLYMIMPTMLWFLLFTLLLCIGLYFSNIFYPRITKDDILKQKVILSKNATFLEKNRWLNIFYFFSIGIFFFLLTAGMQNRSSDIGTSLYHFCFNYFPFFASQRVPHKMILPTYCLLVCVIGLVSGAFLEALKKRGGVSSLYKMGFIPTYWVVLLGCIVYQISVYKKFYPYIQLPDVRIDFYEDLHRVIRANVKDEIIVSLPINNGQHEIDGVAMYHALHTEKRYYSGYLGSPPETFLRHLNDFNVLTNGSIPERTYSIMKSQHVGFLLFDFRFLKTHNGFKKIAGLPNWTNLYESDKFGLVRLDHFPTEKEKEVLSDEDNTYIEGWSGLASKMGKNGQWMIAENGKIHSRLKFQRKDQEPLPKKLVITYIAAKNIPIRMLMEDQAYSLPAGANQIFTQEFAFPETNNEELLITFEGEKVYEPSIEDGVLDLASYGHFLVDIKAE